MSNGLLDSLLVVPDGAGLRLTSEGSLLGSLVELPTLPGKLPLQFLHARQIEQIFCCNKLLVLVKHGVARDRLVLLGTEDEADGWPVTLRAPLAVEETDVAVHLADVLVGELAKLEVDEQEAFQDHVVEDEVDVEVLVLEREALLPGNEGEAFADLEQEMLQLLRIALSRSLSRSLALSGKSRKSRT